MNQNYFVNFVSNRLTDKKIDTNAGQRNIGFTEFTE